MDDGGVVALTGYLYQLLGTAAALAEQTRNTYSLVLLEAHGEDALLRITGKHTLCQYKYSDTAAPITPQDLAAILLKLEAHSESSGAESWELITNRRRSVTTDAVVRKLARDATTFARVDPNDIATIERLGPKLTWKHLEFDDALGALKERCRVFGLNDDEELRSGANLVVGTMIRIIRDHGAGAPFTLDQLDAALVGIKNPGRLDGPKRCLQAARAIEDRFGIHSPTLDQVVPRRCLQNLLNSGHSVVVVEGHGGSPTAGSCG